MEALQRGDVRFKHKKQEEHQAGNKGCNRHYPHPALDNGVCVPAKCPRRAGGRGEVERTNIEQCKTNLPVSNTIYMGA